MCGEQNWFWCSRYQIVFERAAFRDARVLVGTVSVVFMRHDVDEAKLSADWDVIGRICSECGDE
jgi:hypothetical protein